MLALLLPTLAHAGFADKVTDPIWWEGIAEAIPVEGWAITIGTIAFDMILRRLKTQKPKSVLRGVAVAFLGLARVFDRLARMLDKVAGQAAELPRAPVVPPTIPDVAFPIQPPVTPKEILLADSVLNGKGAK